jgi:hypothetical protein
VDMIIVISAVSAATTKVLDGATEIDVLELLATVDTPKLEWHEDSEQLLGIFVAEDEATTDVDEGTELLSWEIRLENTEGTDVDNVADTPLLLVDICQWHSLIMI